jgi:hypothetical protein
MTVRLAARLYPGVSDSRLSNPGMITHETDFVLRLGKDFAAQRLK